MIIYVAEFFFMKCYLKDKYSIYIRLAQMYSRPFVSIKDLKERIRINYLKIKSDYFDAVIKNRNKQVTNICCANRKHLKISSWKEINQLHTFHLEISNIS